MSTADGNTKETPAPYAPYIEQRVTLEKVLADTKLQGSLIGKKTWIYSGEHHCWWRNNASGYTMDIRAAGVYDFDDAFKYTAHLDPSKKIVFEIVSKDWFE